MIRQIEPLSFVARIWLERKTNGDPIWRGQIRHVQGKQETHFKNLGEMTGFMEQVAQVPGLETDEHELPEGTVETTKSKN
jgi:hypothetical protein